MAISTKMGRQFWWLFLDAKEMRFEESISAVMRDRWSKFRRAGKPSDLEMKIGGQGKIRRRGDSQRGCVPFLGDSYLQGTTRENAVGSGLLVAGRHRGIASRMVAVFHFCHEPGLAVVGGILLSRRCRGYLGVSEHWERAAHDAGQKRRPPRKGRGHSRLH